MARDAKKPLVLWDVVEECGDEAEFLWRQWEQALVSPHYNLREVRTWVEDRLLGALDGMRVGGQEAEQQILVPALEAEEPTRVSAAACAAAMEATPALVAALAEQWRHADGPALTALRRGVERIAAPALLAELQMRLGDAEPAARAALLEAYAYRRQAPARLVEEAAASDDPRLIRAALLAAASLDAAPPFVARSLDSPDAVLRETAIVTGMVLGLPAAWEQAKQELSAGRSGEGARWPLVAALGGNAEQAHILALLSDEAQRKKALRAAGFCGTREAADACIELLRQGVENKLAADAFCTITGLALAEHKLIEKEAPANATDDEPVAFEDDNLDTNLALAEEDALPMPQVSGVLAWWEAHRSNFGSGGRYLAGQPRSPEALIQGLCEGTMRRRRTLALELAVRSQGLWVQTDAFTQEQWRQLHHIKSMPGEALRRSPLGRELSAI